MTAEELLKPRFEVIESYPYCEKHKVFVGGIISFDYLDDAHNQYYNDNGKRRTYDEYYNGFPHLFKKLNWWEHRKIEDMPKKVMSLADDKKSIYEIEEWDMEILVGWIDKKNRSCCSLMSFNPEYGYIPID
jgi:hypothetical protein